MCLVFFAFHRGASPAHADWPQWGGPDRNFTVETRRLADSWPEDGPKTLWSRRLGAGYSGIVSDGDVIYTMYRTDPKDHEEKVVALDAKTGETVWEHENEARRQVEPDERWGGLGPNSTPLIFGQRLYTVGSNALMHCFDKRDGKVLWRRDLAKDFKAPFPNERQTGFCSSPIGYRGNVIVAVGRVESNETDQTEGPSPAKSLVAFDGETGREVWKSLDFGMAFASPILITLDGIEQLVLYSPPGLVGVDPVDGALLWSHDMPGRSVVPTPVWDGGKRIFCVIGENPLKGCVLEVIRAGDTYEVREVASSRKIRVMLPTPVPAGDYLYTATDRILLAVDFGTGERVWAKRGFPNASCIYADGKLIILDENGQLTLATPTPDGLTIHSQCTVTERYSLTAPTLDGTTLYVRDRRNILALDLR
jgi:outer membrane protein assembly factor BamB